jgi:hypothetical protein
VDTNVRHCLSVMDFQIRCTCSRRLYKNLIKKCRKLVYPLPKKKKYEEELQHDKSRVHWVTATKVEPTHL